MTIYTFTSKAHPSILLLESWQDFVKCECQHVLRVSDFFVNWNWRYGPWKAKNDKNAPENRHFSLDPQKHVEGFVPTFF